MLTTIQNPKRALTVGLAVLFPFVSMVALLLTFSYVSAWDEERLVFYEPWSNSAQAYPETQVSSIHFDLVGALALAAGFSITDAATIQLYSQLTDSELITGSQVYSLTPSATFVTAPSITEVMTSTICPSPSTTGAAVTMGSTDLVKCPSCFTSRFGPYSIFFHFPHDTANELGAIRDWAFGNTTDLIGVATFGYSDTTQFMWQGIANVFESTPCFVTQTVTIDTGHVEAGSPEAFGIYLHSLGDHWSHLACIEAADRESKPFAAHVAVPPDDPLAPCRWPAHQLEFGDARRFPDSNRTFNGILALYEAFVEYAAQSDRVLYKPIPLRAEGNHIYDTLQTFVHEWPASDPQPRRNLAEELRQWSLEIRSRKPAYWLHHVYLPLVIGE